MKTPATPNLKLLQKELHSLKDPRRAEGVARFFKCGEGEYGEGDQFLGLTVPQVRKLARTYRALSLADLQALPDSPWHEARLTGLIILVASYRAAESDSARTAMYRFYLRNLDAGRINNWDLVDVSCGYVVGAYLKDRDRKPLFTMARSSHLWTRRVAVISTFSFIMAGEWEDTLRISELLMSDRHDLIHKATGWMLREVGKRASEPALVAFLEKHAATMPRTMLRYAIERFDEKRRKDFMARRSRGGKAEKLKS